jgi:hypothetical protein
VTGSQYSRTRVTAGEAGAGNGTPACWKGKALRGEAHERGGLEYDRGRCDGQIRGADEPQDGIVIRGGNPGWMFVTAHCADTLKGRETMQEGRRHPTVARIFGTSFWSSSGGSGRQSGSIAEGLKAGLSLREEGGTR